MYLDWRESNTMTDYEMWVQQVLNNVAAEEKHDKIYKQCAIDEAIAHITNISLMRISVIHRLGMHIEWHRQMLKEIFIGKIGGLTMSDLLNELLKNSMEREAKKLASNGGVTEQDRYGNLLDSVKGRDIAQEETDKYYGNVSQVLNTAKNNRLKREKTDAENARNLQRIVSDVESRERREADAFVDRNKKYLDKAKETISRERNKSYFD